MSNDTAGRVRESAEITGERVAAADGLRKEVLFDGTTGADDVALRRFTLAADGEVPRHTNDVEHVQYVVSGEYVVGLGDTEHTVQAGDAIHVPAGAVHWYRNDGDETGVFLCAVPTGDDDIRLVE
ncbi:MAG: cupin domain-containing protein [Halovenus sp.]